MPLVTFYPSGHSVRTPRGEHLIEAVRASDIDMITSCGGRGTCGSCAVRVIEGQLAPPCQAEEKLITKTATTTASTQNTTNPRLSSIRFACLAQVVSDVTIEVMRKLSPDVVTAGSLASSCKKSNNSNQKNGDLTTREDGVLLQFLGNTELMLAVDLGTTNVSVAAIDPNELSILATGHARNSQSIYGADVMSRMSAAMAGNAEKLRQQAHSSVLEAIADLGLGSAQQVLERTSRIVIAANSVMATLFAGEDISSLTYAPYSAPFLDYCNEGPLIDLWTSSNATTALRIEMFPVIESFVGGDCRAALVATGMNSAHSREISLLVDLGTNAEVALRVGSNLYVTSAAAGCALEGGFIKDEFFTGSEILALVAEDIERGAISPLGTNMSEVGGATLPASIVGDVQLAKAAICTAVQIVMDEASIQPTDIGNVYFTGTFGQNLSSDVIETIGLLPAGMCSSLTELPYTYFATTIATQTPNAALIGAAAVSIGERSSIEGNITHVDLAQHPDFARLYRENLSFS